MPSGSNYNFTVGARIVQQPSGAAGTIKEYDATSDPEKMTLTDITGTFAAGFLDTNGDPFQGLTSSQSVATIVLSAIFNGVFETGDQVSGSGSGALGTVTAYDGNTNTHTLNFITKSFDTSDTLSEPGGTSATITSINYSGDSYDAYPTAAPSFPSDDKEVLVYHRNHGMHQRTNNVEIMGVKSEVPDTTLTTTLAQGSTSIQVQDGSQFHQIIGGATIGNLNPGYMKIGDEIIQYSAISANGQVITVATSGRGAFGTADVEHPSGTVVECYNLMVFL